MFMDKPWPSLRSCNLSDLPSHKQHRNRKLSCEEGPSSINKKQSRTHSLYRQVCYQVEGNAIIYWKACGSQGGQCLCRERSIIREELSSFHLSYSPYFFGIIIAWPFHCKNQQWPIFPRMRCWNCLMKLCLLMLRTHHPPYPTLVVPLLLSQSIRFLVSFWILFFVNSFKFYLFTYFSFIIVQVQLSPFCPHHTPCPTHPIFLDSFIIIFFPVLLPITHCLNN